MHDRLKRWFTREEWREIVRQEQMEEVMVRRTDPRLQCEHQAQVYM